jgi:hypothetical protein
MACEQPAVSQFEIPVPPKPSCPGDARSARCPYERRFDAPDIEAVLATMHRDVVWANGMEGGYVYGHEGLRKYWTRQCAMIDGRTEPPGFSAGADKTIDVEVHRKRVGDPT